MFQSFSAVRSSSSECLRTSFAASSLALYSAPRAFLDANDAFESVESPESAAAGCPAEESLRVGAGDGGGGLPGDGVPSRALLLAASRRSASVNDFAEPPVFALRSFSLAAASARLWL